MITSLEIEGYRGFSRFEMTNLGRINLLVGKNNSGKTSVLEALNLLESGSDPLALWNILSRRGEHLFLETQASARRLDYYELEVGHLFQGHKLEIGSSFSIRAKNQRAKHSLTCSVVRTVVDPSTKERRQREQLQTNETDPEKPAGLGLLLEPSPRERKHLLHLSRRGTLRYDLIDSLRGRRGTLFEGQGPGTTQFVTTESVAYDQLASMWNAIALTDAQDRVVTALRFIDERVQQIAPLVASPYLPSAIRGGFIVKLADSREPVPIGSLGDGMWRILALAISISRATDGLLLVDEIDTGLHYSVMSEMWRLIYDAAEMSNVQVFATTHSYDCVHSLATICEPGSADITIQRIEPRKETAVHYSGSEIRRAAEMHIEVR